MHPPEAARSPFVHRLRVRYVECDMQGIVFNAHYYTWMDVAHTEWLRAHFGALALVHELGVDVVVAESSARFRASARFDEEIDIKVRLTALSTTSMTTTHTFCRQGQVLVEGSIRHVCVDRRTFTKTPWPTDLRAAAAAVLAPGA